MARDQEPLTDEELAEFKEKMEEGSKEIREDLAEDFDGDPDDDRDQPVADGDE